jgi:hypothetical protein
MDRTYGDELPEDAIVVENYNNHNFVNLYYSNSLRRFIVLETTVIQSFTNEPLRRGFIYTLLLNKPR